MTYKDLDREIRKLPADGRIGSAHNLLQSVEEEPDPEYERLWMEEIERRCQEFEEGKVEGIPAEQVIAEIRAKLASMQYPPEILEDVKTARPFEEIKGDAFQLPADERLDLAYAILRDLQDEGFKIDWETPEVVGTSQVSHPHE